MLPETKMRIAVCWDATMQKRIKTLREIVARPLPNTDGKNTLNHAGEIPATLTFILAGRSALPQAVGYYITATACQPLFELVV